MKKYNRLILCAMATYISLTHSAYERDNRLSRTLSTSCTPQEKLAAAQKDLQMYEAFVHQFPNVFEVTPDHMQKIAQTLQEKTQNVVKAQQEIELLSIIQELSSGANNH